MNKKEQPTDREVITRLESLRPVPERDPEAARQGRERFLAEARSLEAPVSIPLFQRLIKRFKPTRGKEIGKMRQQFSMSTAVIAVIVTLGLVFGGVWATASAAQGALPGDTLFPVKTIIEDAQVALAQDAADDAQLQMEFAQKRLDETAELIAAGRFGDVQRASNQFEAHLQKAIDSLGTVAAGDPARAQSLAFAIVEALSRYSQVLNGMLAAAPADAQPALQNALQTSENLLNSSETEFTGTIESIEGESWLIDGQRIIIASFTEMEGTFQVGDLVKVHAIPNSEGILTAREIEFAGGEEGEDLNENANDNGMDDELNENANDNGENDELNENANDNGENDELNENANDNGNSNANDNDDDDDGNSNANDNDDDDNGNSNANDNDDDDDGNSNANDNDDDGDKSNSNDNEKDDDND